uniref:Uncharacterized protein n=1 Tax=Corvus moneduloides TaxID=1196302 RepID=A0A8U7MMK6_CORMO
MVLYVMCIVSFSKYRLWKHFFSRTCSEDSKGYLSREDSTVGLVMFFYLFIFYIFLGPLFEKFLNLMSAKKVAQLNSNGTSKYLQERGFLTFEDFKRAFNSVSPKLSEKIVFEAIREVNQDSDGCISFKAFESAMKYGRDEVSPMYFA